MSTVYIFRYDFFQIFEQIPGRNNGIHRHPINLNPRLNFILIIDKPKSRVENYDVQIFTEFSDICRSAYMHVLGRNSVQICQ